MPNEEYNSSYTGSQIDTAVGKALSATSSEASSGTALFTNGGAYTLHCTVNSMMATIQTTLVASKSYAVNECFVYDDEIYVVTSAISSGGTIVIGTNCELTTISDVMYNMVIGAMGGSY